MKKKKTLKLRKTRVSKLTKLTRINGGSSEICSPTIGEITNDDTTYPKGTTDPTDWQ